MIDMITEIAILNIKENKSSDFENSFQEAQKIISKMKGYSEHELLKCMEEENKYLLIVRWQKLADHTEGFRKSDAYQSWKKMLHHYYEPFPVVEPYKQI
jgi:heme-degrading monooxygenase HmoA